MPVYKLDIVDRVAPAWQGTAIATGGWVRADCERDARRCFGEAEPRKRGASSSLVIFSPWYDTRVTNCRLDQSHEDLTGGMIELTNGLRLKIKG